METIGKGSILGTENIFRHNGYHAYGAKSIGVS